MRHPSQLWLPSLEDPRPEVSGKGLFIEADAAEEASGIPALLRGAGVRVQSLRLPAGDYLIERRLLVERKAAGDFAGSLFDGRLFRQLQYLKHAAMSTLLVVEGCRAYYEAFWPRSLRSALLSVTADFRVPVLFTRRPEATAGLLLDMAARWARRRTWERFEPARRRRFSWSGSTRRFAREFEALLALEGVGPHLALQLLGSFRGLKALRAADAKALLAVRGVGKKKAAAISAGLRPAGVH